jgi:hypothetical protein
MNGNLGVHAPLPETSNPKLYTCFKSGCMNTLIASNSPSEFERFFLDPVLTFDHAILVDHDGLTMLIDQAILVLAHTILFDRGAL